MPNKAVIEISNLEFSYEKTCILQNVNLTIHENEFIGIFGPNGGGKTTFLKLLMGFLKPTQGSIRILGESPSLARTKIGYVPQFVNVDKQFPISTLDVVLMGLLSSLSYWGFYPKAIQRKAELALEQVGLLDYKNQPFGTLSGGQAQRVLIARAIVSSPKILLLDESTTSLDLGAEQKIENILTELKKSMTILMVTHNLHTATKKTGRLLCIQKEITSFSPQAVCEHFALGLYHSPLMPGGSSSGI